MADQTGLQMPNGLQMPAIPSVTATAPAPTTGATGGLTTTPPAPATPAVPNLTPAQSGLAANAGVPAGQAGSPWTAPSATPTAFQTQSAPAVTLHPDIVTPSGATVNPSTGALVSPPPDNSALNTGNGVAPAAGPPAGMNLGTPAVPAVPAATGATATAQFYKPGPNDPGYDASNPQAVYDSSGKALDYTSFINAGGKADFSNVTTGGVPGQTAAPAAPDITDINSSYYTNPEVKAAQSAYQTAQQLTPEEVANQNKIDNLESGLGISEANTENQPIPLEFITGQKAALEKRALALEAPLQKTDALLQAKRTAAVEASKYALDNAQAKLTAFQGANKPVSTPIGTSLTFPGTGKQIGGLGSATGAGKADATSGASDAQILGYLQANGLQGTRYNMVGLISAVRQGYSAQDIISGKANLAGATAGAAAQASNKSQFTLDGNGNLIEVTPHVTGASGSAPSGQGAFSAKNTTAPAATQPSGTKFTLGADGKTVMADGKPIDLATFKQMTGQTNVADSQVNFSAVQGNKPAAPAKTTAPASSSSSVTPAVTGLSATANQYFLSGDISKTGVKSSNSINQINQQVQDYAKSIGIDNWSAAKVAALNAGDAANYAQQVQYLTTTARSVSNAENGFKQVLSQFPDLNKASSPLWNKTANELAAHLTGGQRNAFEAGLTEIANEYSQVFSRGGANTVSSHVAASDIVNGNLSMKDLQGVLTELQAQGKIVVDGAKTAVNGIMNGFGGKQQNANGHTTGQVVPGGDGKNYVVGADGNYYPQK